VTVKSILASKPPEDIVAVILTLPRRSYYPGPPIHTTPTKTAKILQIAKPEFRLAGIYRLCVVRDLSDKNGSSYPPTELKRLLRENCQLFGLIGENI